MLRMLELESFVLDEQQNEIVRHNAERLGERLDFTSYNDSLRSRTIFLLDADIDAVVSIQDEFPIYSFDEKTGKQIPNANCTLIIRAQYPNALVVDKKYLLKGKALEILEKINVQLNKWEKEDIKLQNKLENNSFMISQEEMISQMQDKTARHVGTEILNKFFKDNPNYQIKAQIDTEDDFLDLEFEEPIP